MKSQNKNNANEICFATQAQKEQMLESNKLTLIQ